jgi:two-component system NtrC family sensor kinase
VGRQGLQAEILASLSLVMLTASGVLAAVLLRTHDARLGQLRDLAARSLVRDARSPILPEIGSGTGLRWWTAGADGALRPRGAQAGAPDPALEQIAADARRGGQPLLWTGSPWQPIRLAVPLEGGALAVAELPAAIPAGLLLGLLAADVAVFTGFGAYLLRRRVVRPLQQLAGAARALGQGVAQVRAPVEGVGETRELGRAFNEMSEALERRGQALEKAVAELRDSNRRLREARAGMDRAERLAAVGRLAAGVAHEVGNPMGAVLAFLDLARREPGLSEHGRDCLEKAARQGERVRQILRQLLDYSRPRRPAPLAVDVADACQEVVELVRAQRRYADVCLSVERRGDPPPALADPGILAQIVLNLLLNAADAVAGSGAGEIAIRVGPAVGATRRGEDAAPARQRRHADAVECRVRDNGPGIPAEDRERIFDPFFTTKPPGQGTGLGLANAARLAEELGGSLELAEPGAAAGAEFVLRLPSAAEVGSEPRAAE